MGRRIAVITTMVVGTVAFLALIVVSVITTKGRDIQMIHIIMRHGERTPADTYPKDPYLHEKFYPVGWGQLTNRGKAEVYNLGRFLRNRYDKFLGDFYSSDLYYTQTTDSDRTKVTGQLLNAGLWPPSPDQKWGSLDWQPIATHSEPLGEDNLLLVRRPCPQYHIEFQRVMNLPEIHEKLKANEELFNYIQEHTGKNIEVFDDVQDVFSTLMAEERFNLTLPEWTQGYYPDKMYEPTVFSFIVNQYTDKLIKLKGGVLLKKILNDWKTKADGSIKPAERKGFLYVGHDSTIVNLMRALKVWDPQLPTYAIMILLELSKDPATNEYGIEVYLKNSTDVSVPPHQLSIPNCGNFCPLTKLEELSKSVLPENWEEECKTDIEGFTVPPLGGP